MASLSRENEQKLEAIKILMNNADEHLLQAVNNLSLKSSYTLIDDFDLVVSNIPTPVYEGPKGKFFYYSPSSPSKKQQYITAKSPKQYEKLKKHLKRVANQTAAVDELVSAVLLDDDDVSVFSLTLSEHAGNINREFVDSLLEDRKCTADELTTMEAEQKNIADEITTTEAEEKNMANPFNDFL